VISKRNLPGRFYREGSCSGGNIPEEIISTAEDEDVSLIAISPHGKGWFKELLVEAQPVQ